MPPGIPETDARVIDLVRRYEESWRAQDLARAEAWAKIRGGSQSPEALAYVVLCVAQVKANMAQFMARNRAAMMLGGAAPDEQEAMRALQRHLGISAIESDDDEAGSSK